MAGTNVPGRFLRSGAEFGVGTGIRVSNKTKSKKLSGVQQRELERKAKLERSQRRGGSVPVLVGIGLLAAAAIAIALLLVLRDGGSGADPISINGVAIPAFDSTQDSDPAFGQKAPLLQAESVTGEYVFFGGGGGPNDTAKVVLLVSHACDECEMAVENFIDWSDTNGVGDGIELVIMTVDEDADGPNYPPSEWLASLGWSGATVRDDVAGTIMDSFGFSESPSWIVLSDLNFVLDRQVGVLDAEGIARLAKIAEFE